MVPIYISWRTVLHCKRRFNHSSHGNPPQRRGGMGWWGRHPPLRQLFSVNFLAMAVCQGYVIEITLALGDNPFFTWINIFFEWIILDFLESINFLNELFWIFLNVWNLWMNNFGFFFFWMNKFFEWIICMFSWMNKFFEWIILLYDWMNYWMITKKCIINKKNEWSVKKIRGVKVWTKCVNQGLQ